MKISFRREDMKPNHIYSQISILALLCLIMILGCEYDKAYEPVWKWDEEFIKPEITGVEPDSAFEGITEIKIIGHHFSTEIEKNVVYFGIEKGVIQNLSDTCLSVIRPIRISGSLMIKLSVQDLFYTAEYGPYKLEEGIVRVGEGLNKVGAIAMDADENVYAYQNNTNIVYQITPDGELLEYGSLNVTISAMRMGSDGYLYLQRSNRKELYRIAPDGGGEVEEFIQLIRPVSCFDFDEDGYIYSGGKIYGLCVTNPDGSNSRIVEQYEKLTVKAVRVFKEYVYVAVDTAIGDQFRGRAIYRYEILGNGSLGNKDLYYDWFDSGIYSGTSIQDFTFSEEGDMVVATESLNGNMDPIITIRSDNQLEVLYEGVFEPPVTCLCWGNGNYIYMIATEDAVVSRAIMGKKGAVYYGR